MTASPSRSLIPTDAAIDRRVEESLQRLHLRTDRFFGRLLLAEWCACLLVACIVSPRAWAGMGSTIHPHIWAALFLGAVIVLYPVWLGLRQPGRTATRHLLAAAQMLLGSLLIHLCGGRLETHFYIFGSLAFLAFYRDVRVLLTASVVVYLDHLLRGAFWPESVYGVYTASLWRSAEHAFWVFFEVAFLWISIRASLGDVREAALRQLSVEAMNGEMERLVAERTGALRQSEERFRVLFEEAPVGLYRADPDGLLVLANPTLLRILGYANQEELLAAGIRLQSGIEAEGHRAFLAEAAAKGQIQGHDSVWQHRDGSSLFVRESVRALRSPRNEILFFDGSVEDVTERRKLEERYLQSQKMQAIGQLAGGVAHDFNNIVTAILGYADLLLDTSALQPAAPGFVREIKQAGERAAGLTRQLLAFSRKQTLQPRTLSFNTVIAEMDPMLRRLVGEHIDIRTHFSPDLGVVKADPGQIQQVVMNLAVNARDAMPDGGKLTIETLNAALDADYCRLHPEAAPGEYVLIAVTDSGIGMSAQIQSRLFEPFFTTKEQGKGTGLGLATCHGIVKQSGGHIAVYSEAGIGTTFRVYLPRTGEAVDKSPALPERLADVRGGSEQILFVEDEPMVRHLGNLALSSVGYRVIEAAHGRDALRLVSAPGHLEEVALVVTDVVMPEMGGAELVRQLRARSPGLRVLFTSGYTHDAIGRTDLLEPGTHFLSKPYGMAFLAKRVREILDEPV